jgi:peptide/nickel transport system ATP-binding protein
VSSSSEAPLLAVEGLKLAAGTAPLVEELSFALARGETLAIAGESGSGKSLTALAIMGLLPPGVRVTGGSIRFQGEDILALPARRRAALRGDRIAMIFQEPMTSLNPIMTVGTQLAEAVRAHAPVSRAEARARALTALDAVRLSEPGRRLGQFPHELSGGMRQRVMIAMAMLMRPDLLIADEPTTALDVTVQREVLDLLRTLQAETGMALILITHDMGVVAETADRVLVMRAGRAVETARAARLFAAPEAPYTQGLLAAVPRLGTAGPPRAAAQEAPGEPPVAELAGLTVRFPLRGGVLGRVTHIVHAVEGVSLGIRRSETLALVGESGSGKSTVARAIAGLVPHEGRIAVAGRPVAAAPGAAGRRALAREVQLIFQDPKAALDPRMRAGDLVAEPLLIHGIGGAAERRERVAALMARVGLDPGAMDRYPHEFSGGQRQRLCIARALALGPRLILADECVSALDVQVQARVLALLQELQSELGLALLFISHDMAVVERMADRVAVMYLGQIVETGSRAQVLGRPRHPYTQRLLAAVPVADPARRRPPAPPRPPGEVPGPVRRAGDPPARVTLREVEAGHLVAI